MATKGGMPVSVRIGGIRYSIVEESSDLNGPYIGYINHVQSRITISDREMGHQMRKSVLVHEIMHGIDEQIGAGDRVSEEENTARANAVFAFLRDPANQSAVRWIIEPES